MKLSVIMPVYNERANINEIIQKVLDVLLDKELIIVDDYSHDGTRKYLSAINDNRIKVVFHEKNYGKGAAIQTGLKNASGDWIVIQDADLEYNPQDYFSLIKPILEQKSEVVYGSRFMGEGFRSFSPLQLFANRLLTGLTNILFGTRLTDMETCYKVVPRLLLEGLNLESRGFEIEPEITAKLLKRGKEILEVPISYKGRKYHEGKKIRAQDCILSIFTLIKYRFSKSIDSFRY